MKVSIKRVYAQPATADGYRILVDRLWPRGMKKEEAHVDNWAKDIAPSAELRKWFNHDVEKWVSFGEKYKSELQDTAAWTAFVEEVKKHATITLLFAAKDEAHNNAVILRELLRDQ